MLLRVTEGTRARRVITRSPTRTVGRFPSLKAGRSIHWESQLERDFVYLLEFDPIVLDYREQPETIRLTIDGKPRRYTPDFLVRTASLMVVYEVKPADKAAHPDMVALFAAAADHYAGRGMRHQVATEADIRIRPYLDNVGLLLRYRSHPVDADIEARILDRLAFEPAPLGELVAALAPHADMAEVLALLANRRLAADLARRLDRDAVIRLPGEG